MTAILIAASALMLFLTASGFRDATLIIFWFSLIPLLELIRRSATPRRAFFLCWTAGSLFFSVQISWILSAAPLNWMGIESIFWGTALTAMIWLTSSMVLGIFPGLFGLLLKRVKISWWWLAAPTFWTVMEYARAWGFGIFWTGNESIFGPYWTFGHIGYAGVHIAILRIASKLVGLYGLGFFIALPSALIFSCLLRQKLKTVILKPLLISLVLTVAVIGYGILYAGHTEQTQRQVEVSLIQTDFPQGSYFGPVAFTAKAYTDAALVGEAAAAMHAPDQLIVLPEASLVATLWGNDTYTHLRALTKPSTRVRLIDTARAERFAPSPERIYYFDNTKGLAAYQNKKLLVPFGEYLPFAAEGTAKILGKTAWLNTYAQFRGHTRAGEPPDDLNADNQPEGTLVCSGIFAPSLYYRLAAGNAELLVNTTSQSVFKGNILFRTQAEMLIRFIAASSDRFFLQAANGGYNYIIDNNGVIRQQSQDMGFGIIRDTVPYRTSRTPIVRFGDWPLFALVALSAIFLASKRFTA